MVLEVAAIIIGVDLDAMTDKSSDARDHALDAFREAHGLESVDAADLNQALTHRSYAYEAGVEGDNERLEFLGDAVISAITSQWLYETEAEADEGTLSKLRSRLVSRAALGRRALQMGLDELILLGRGERESGGARRRSTLGSALEAVVGIVYLRLGFDATREFVREHLIRPIHAHSAEGLQEDYKSILQEWAQQQYKRVPTYRRLKEEGPDHQKRFTVEVEVAGQVLARGSGRRIKQAENEAARQGLESVRAQPPSGESS